MLRKIAAVLFLLMTTTAISVEHQETTTPPPPPKPYAFGYAAGRFPGNIDRTHSEVSDGSVVHGTYSYIDPRLQIRTVEYTADKNGFHPVLNRTPPPLPSDTPQVAAAKAKHARLFQQLAERNGSPPGHVPVPHETVAVQMARARHLADYERIAVEHAKIAARQLQEELAKNGVEGLNEVAH